MIIDLLIRSIFHTLITQQKLLENLEFFFHSFIFKLIIRIESPFEFNKIVN